MHLKTETAFDLMEGRMERHLAREWMDHMDSCRSCRVRLDGWQVFRSSLKRPHLQSAPGSLVESAIALFHPPSKASERPTLRQIIASLIYDSFAQPAFAGARGEAATRQVVLRAEEFDIHVRIWEANESRELLGQIQSRRSTSFVRAARLHLLRGGERVSSAQVNELGEFHFSYVPDGYLSLQIDLPHLTVIGALDMKDRPNDNF